jgi:hypothetical protein
MHFRDLENHSHLGKPEILFRSVPFLLIHFSAFTNLAHACWQALPAKSNVFEQSRNLPEWGTFQVLHSRVGPWPYPQTIRQGLKGLPVTNKY